MRFALNAPNFGPYADVAAMVELARVAERSGWDGLFIWDHVTWQRSQPQPIADPWVLLTAIALATSRLRLGTMVTPVARRRPTKLARETTTLDHVSNGRLTLGVGLGSPLTDEFTAVGEPSDPKLLAKRLDEGLEILAAAWSGDPVTYRGQTQRVDGVTFLPRPVQRPRIPIWVGGTWPRRAPLRRALRWDGAVFTYLDENADGTGWRSARPHEIAELAQLAQREHHSPHDFDIVVGGRALDDDAHLLEPLATAGATWWQEPLGPHYRTWDDVLARAQHGPPQLGP
jgi:alkanesulfonate monooxygenase SsuD/methylene tetrahydromethanopterin reductase-like flavin-dependent oxidoreductase (luciferase family)